MSELPPGRFVECINADCRRPIPIPYSILRGIPGSRNSWHEVGETANLVCPECDLVYDYTGSPVRGDPSPLGDPYQSGVLRDALLVFDCAQENCGTQVVIHRPTEIGMTGRDVEAEAAAKWKFVGVHCQSPNGDTVVSLPEDGNYWALFR
jgi:hypothetical protein